MALTNVQAEVIVKIWNRANVKHPWDIEWVQREVLNVIFGSWDRINDSKKRYAICKAYMLKSSEIVKNIREEAIVQTIEKESQRKALINSKLHNIKDIEDQLLADAGLLQEEWEFYRHSVKEQAKKIHNEQERRWKSRS